MPKPLTPEQIAAAISRGAETEVKPKSIEIVNAESFLKHMRGMAQDLTEAQKKSQAAILSALQRLTEAVIEKEMAGTDVSGLIEAIAALKTETETVQHHEPVAWKLTVDYTNQGRISEAYFTPIKEFVL